jgi:hypothetical protein
LIAPYLAKVDSIGDSGLSTIDSHFPIVKAETSTIQEKVQGVAGIPWKIASDGKAYVFKTYDEEYNASQGNGIVKHAKAAIGTELKITLALFQVVTDFLSKAKQEGKEKAESVEKKLQS